jgi:hypothetical protein
MSWIRTTTGQPNFITITKHCMVVNCTLKLEVDNLFDSMGDLLMIGAHGDELLPTSERCRTPAGSPAIPLDTINLSVDPFTVMRIPARLTTKMPVHILGEPPRNDRVIHIIVPIPMNYLHGLAAVLRTSIEESSLIPQPRIMLDHKEHLSKIRGRREAVGS